MKKRVKAAPSDCWFGNIEGEFFEVELRSLTRPPTRSVDGWRILCKGSDDFMLCRDFLNEDFSGHISAHAYASMIYAAIDDRTSIESLKEIDFEVF